MDALLKDSCLEMEHENIEALEQRLCKACGFCCDGTLFLNVRIRESEPIHAYKKAGLQLAASTEGTTIMKQPCTGFKNGSCQTYQCRPLRCGEFKCTLLHQAGEGALTESKALQLIQETKQLRSNYSELLLEIFPQFEKKALASHYRNIRKASKHLSGESLNIFRIKKSQLKEYKEILQTALDTYFYNSQETNEHDPSESA